ncbi:hypothetical protein P7K49_000189 [Saguinus oedipus]|uniref:Uncharacterized protein n=1 Tax=Saguinus oedipus TaxID=9490 RepID=A0ABQ9WB00_SAGOE|nr:hypothetical protein P7K49_000189 [Saguinus oedipus]
MTSPQTEKRPLFAAGMRLWPLSVPDTQEPAFPTDDQLTTTPILPWLMPTFTAVNELRMLLGDGFLDSAIPTSHQDFPGRITN